MPRQHAGNGAAFSDEDTITMLVASDNHVGYAERDAIRGDDGWRTFHEIMELAKARDVDMVLLGGDLFHENKPSRKSMFNVMRSLRLNVLGDKPCELELLSDASENFGGMIDHVNYEDEDINVAIPVFSIHGNHDDPTEEGRFAALDLLQMSGLVNYFGKIPESDNISIKPVLIQKGQTKLALYGMSNVRDERLFRTFRDGKVTFFQPGTQKNDWFNLMTVHQNHHAHTQTSYLPENFLPEFVDLVIWGHEHECLIDPRYNPEMNFHVIQPGSSIATSLCVGEAVTKQVAIIKITGKDFKVEPILLKTVRPFIMREVVLAEERALKNLWKKDNNRLEITNHLKAIVEDMIKEAEKQYLAAQDEVDREFEIPKPLIRLRVEYTAPEGGRYDCENPQRFSNRFTGQVANESDVVQFYRKKVIKRRSKNEPEIPDQVVIGDLGLDNIKVDQLVREFLSAQSLTILPQNTFGDAVSQFVDKDDKHSMEVFVDESLTNQLKHLVTQKNDDEEEIQEAIDGFRSKLEHMFSTGLLKKRKKTKLKPHPDGWNSDFDGHWEDEPAATVLSDASEQENGHDESSNLTTAVKATSGARGRRGRGRGSRGGAVTSTRKTIIRPEKVVAASSSRGRMKKKDEMEEEQEDDDDDDDSAQADIKMLSGGDEDDSETIFVRQATSKKTKVSNASTRQPSSAQNKILPCASTTRQGTLNFSQATRSDHRRPKPVEISDDEISDEDAFEPAQSTSNRR